MALTFKMDKKTADIAILAGGVLGAIVIGASSIALGLYLAKLGGAQARVGYSDGTATPSGQKLIPQFV